MDRWIDLGLTFDIKISQSKMNDSNVFINTISLHSETKLSEMPVKMTNLTSSDPFSPHCGETLKTSRKCLTENYNEATRKDNQRWI